ncbi:MAG: bifunctional serine/threonine-protein kinase/formylglycine-generating enzyme family protein [Pyrinomonadaceae bacterium]
MKECQHCKSCYSDEVNSCPKDGMPTVHTIAGEPVLDGKYNIESRIGQGGMGVVYKARHAYLKTLYAIKVILPDLVGNDPNLVTRFRQEALAAAAIRHHNVVQVTDYGVAQGTMPFLVMEYVEGESLHDLIAREHRLEPKAAFDLVSAICDGIGAAHHLGIVHRDMKPLNIMLLKGKTKMNEAVKILDFGLAKIKSGELLGSFIQAQTTGLMGSPYYMAPEQWADEDLGPQSDIYSIGVMLYQMLTGDVPFKGSSIPAIMKKHLSDPPPSFSEMGLTATPELERAVMRTLAKKPEDRTATVEDLVEELRAAVLGGETLGAAQTFSSLPSAPLRILTNPPQSDVFLNDVSVGKSRDDGWLLLEGVQTGNHNLRVAHEGFLDWNGQVKCEGKPYQVVAELRKAEATAPGIPMPTDTLSGETGKSISGGTGYDELAPTIHKMPEGTVPEIVPTQPEIEKKPFLSMGTLLIFGILGLFALTGIGIAGIYFSGIYKQFVSGPEKTPEPSPTPSVETTGDFKNELVEIPGGTFKMGRNDGTPLEKPEHEVTVEDFFIDKTEVTNGEYYAFVTETDYDPIPVDWVAMSRKPVSGKEKLPVRFVNIKDVEAFAKWRSKRDGRTYRLPTEAEWEYVARNGDQGTLYPWGDEHRAECAVVGRLAATPEEVGSRECGASSRWGVQDLIGNVFEWTSSESKAYPGAPGELQNRSDKRLFIIRGGSAFRDQNGKNSETSTFRIGVPEDLRDNRLGFRLVSSG